MSEEGTAFSHLMPGIAAFVFVLLLAGHRLWLLRKTRGWRPISATVTDVRRRVNGEEATVLVDVEFLFEGTTVRVRNVTTDHDRITDCPKGSQIRLLVNPQKPRHCIREDYIRSLER